MVRRFAQKLSEREPLTPPERPPSLATLSVKAIFRGAKWGPLKALVDIQRKWKWLRFYAWMQAAELLTDFFQGRIQGYIPVNRYADVEHVRRYLRLGSALRTSQARVRTLAITQRV